MDFHSNLCQPRNKGPQKKVSGLVQSRSSQANKLKPKNQLRAASSTAPQTVQSSNIKQKSCLMRVLLAKQKPHASGTWHLCCSSGFIIRAADQAPAHVPSQLKINIKQSRFYINGRPSPFTKIVIHPKSDATQFNDNTYQGSFTILAKKGVVYLINNLDLESYVFSVLRTESWPGWPLEVNKVFAIACRTYAIAMALSTKKNNRPYHVTNTNTHQTYSGIHSCDIIRQAVDSTRALFLGHNSEPIVAMFDSCCGGVIPSHISDLNINDAPYLGRSYACNHCKRCKIYKWTASFEATELENNLKKECTNLRGLKDIVSLYTLS